MAMRIGTNSDGSGPQMAVAVPDGWYYKESFTLLAPDGQANVILSSEPLDPPQSLEEFATVQGDLLQSEFPGYRELGFEGFTLSEGGDAKLRIFEWEPPGGAPVTQMQVYHVVGQRGVTSTATTPSEHFGDVESILRTTLATIAVRPGTRSVEPSR